MVVDVFLGSVRLEALAVDDPLKAQVDRVQIARTRSRFGNKTSGPSAQGPKDFMDINLVYSMILTHLHDWR